MAVETQSGAPQRITAGDDVIFTVSDATRPSSEWYLDFVLSRDGQRLLTARATTYGATDDYLVTIAASESIKLTPGQCRYVPLFTEISSGQRETDSNSGGYLRIAPDPAGSLPASDAQKALKACSQAIVKLVSSPRASVSFNGQSFTLQNISDLMDARDRLQVQVNMELAAAGVNNKGGVRVIRFRFT